MVWLQYGLLRNAKITVKLMDHAENLKKLKTISNNFAIPSRFSTAKPGSSMIRRTKLRTTYVRKSNA